MKVNEATEAIIGAAIEVHRALGPVLKQGIRRVVLGLRE
jgi:hypothetical protein|tara:strand:- start:232 stop:348 length:117 start_codon:yes stop_codon:yes gene_type:complete